jgi:hypothetical protein
LRAQRERQIKTLKETKWAKDTHKLESTEREKLRYTKKLTVQRAFTDWRTQRKRQVKTLKETN